MQITIYVDEELVREVDRQARKMKLSRSQCVQSMLRERLASRKSERLLDSFGKIPDLDPGVRAHLGPDSPREQLG